MYKATFVFGAVQFSYSILRKNIPPVDCKKNSNELRHNVILFFIQTVPKNLKNTLVSVLVDYINILIRRRRK